MRIRSTMFAAAGLVATLAAPLAAQNVVTSEPAGSQPVVADSGETALAPAAPSIVPQITIQHIRPQDKRGLNMFETPKDDGVPFTGFRLDFGAAFTQQFQNLSHENNATANVVNGVDANQLMDIGAGFNNAAANLYLNAQLAPGIRVALETYLSSRHHQEAWVKDGYLLIDDSPIDVPALKSLMSVLTLKVGHFELDYGDAHYRRTDNGNAMFNPFVGNLIIDAFTTEIGAEAYVRKAGFIAMGGVTGGEIKGDVTNPGDRSLAYHGKLGYDSQVTPAVRLRLTGSAYTMDKGPSNTLFHGNRAGSRYYLVMENTAASTSSQAWSGEINPGFSNKVTAFQVNPFVKFNGLELFGVIEQGKGRTSAETSERTWNQYAGDVVYRFLADEQLYVAARYNTASGRLQGMTSDVSVDRYQLGGGWFITPAVLLKAEYVDQKYNDFPTTSIYSEGKFNGLMFEGVVAF